MYNFTINYMQKFLAFIIITILPFLAVADGYPINKSIDIKHYSFKLSLFDSTDEIVG